MPACAPITYTVTHPDGSNLNSSLASFDSITNTVTVQTDDNSFGVNNPTAHSFVVTGTNNAGISSTAPLVYLVSLDCLTGNTITTPDDPAVADIEYYAYLAAKTVSWKPFVSDPSCPLTYELQLQSDDSDPSTILNSPITSFTPGSYSFTYHAPSNVNVMTLDLKLVAFNFSGLKLESNFQLKILVRCD